MRILGEMREDLDQSLPVVFLRAMSQDDLHVIIYANLQAVPVDMWRDKSEPTYKMDLYGNPTVRTGRLRPACEQ